MAAGQQAIGMDPGHGFAEIGASTAATTGARLWAEAGERLSFGAVFADGWWTPKDGAAGVGVGYRW